MKEYRTTHSIQHTAENMFQLVADIESYPDFVPLCAGLKIRSKAQENGCEILTADMTVAYKFVRETFTSRVTLDKPARSIIVDYLDGPFRTLHNSWKFEPDGERQCNVDFFIAYEFRSKPLQLIAGAAFDKAVRKLTQAFEERADKVYGVNSIAG